MRDKLAYNVRVRRAELGWSQTRLAASANVGRALVNEIEQSKANPTLNILEKLAGALGVSLSDLVA